MSLELTNDREFLEVVPPLTAREAEEEAMRCYYCYDAPCVQACPTGIDIPSFINHIATGDLKASARTIMDANILGATCARICPTEALCEGSCVRVRDSRPVSIGRLQRVAMDDAMANGIPDLPPSAVKGSGRIAVVGAGPAGLSAAAQLARMGHAVEVYEQKEEGGGLDTYGIVSYREPLSVSLFEVGVVRQLGVQFHFGWTVRDAGDIQNLRHKYDAVVIAVGMGKVPPLTIPGEHLEGVYDALDLVEDTKTRPLADVRMGRRVVVIGAGNTAVDAATCAKRLGADEVTILYRRDEAAMSAYRYEYEFAKQDGVTYRWWTAPVAIVGADRVEGVRCVRTQMETGGPSSRKAKLAVAPGSEFTLPADTVVRAIGQETHTGDWEALGAKTQGGKVLINEETYETSVDGVYAAGDCLVRSGDATVVRAVEDGKRAARAINERLARRVAH
ncbi:MAG: NAD(P)-dependent oxidoreductase [Thermaerobacter sp.]|nr:NAD(P)-dependent oxidoreductase [Thermaerobacter sp.]